MSENGEEVQAQLLVQISKVEGQLVITTSLNLAELMTVLIGSIDMTWAKGQEAAAKAQNVKQNSAPGRLRHLLRKGKR